MPNEGWGERAGGGEERSSRQAHLLTTYPLNTLGGQAGTPDQGAKWMQKASLPSPPQAMPGRRTCPEREAFS